MLHEERDVLFSPPQWWNFNSKPIETEIKILSKLSVLYRGLQVSIGGDDYPHIRSNQFRSTEAFKITFFQYSEQHGLCFHREFADLIEKERASGCQFELAENPSIGSGWRNRKRSTTQLVSSQFEDSRGN